MSGGIRGAGDTAAEPLSSPDDCRISPSTVGKVSKCVFPAVPEDQLDRVRQARSGLLFRAVPTVGSRYFRTVRDAPVAISLEDSREGIAHRSTAHRNFPSILATGSNDGQIRKAAGSRRGVSRSRVPRTYGIDMPGGGEESRPDRTLPPGRSGRRSARLNRRPCGSGADGAACARPRYPEMGRQAGPGTTTSPPNSTPRPSISLMATAAHVEPEFCPVVLVEPWHSRYQLVMVQHFDQGCACTHSTRRPALPIRRRFLRRRVVRAARCIRLPAPANVEVQARRTPVCVLRATLRRSCPMVPGFIGPVPANVHR